MNGAAEPADATGPDAARRAVLEATPEPLRSELVALDRAIRDAAPSLGAQVGDGTFGYGRYRYRYASGREGDWFCLTLAARRNGLTLHVGGTTVERWADRLPKASCGKGCIRVRKAEDIDASVLAEIVDGAVRIDGRLLDWTGRAHGDDPVLG